MFCCTILYVHSSFAIILMGKRELVALLSLSSWCLMIVEWLFLAVPWVCLQFVIVVFPDQTHFFVNVMLRKQLSMIMKYHNHTLQTNPWRHEEERQNTDCHMTSGRQLKQRSRFSLSIKMIAKLDGHKVLYNKTRTEHRALQTMGVTINKK